jgi:hypothetical protein
MCAFAQSSFSKVVVVRWAEQKDTFALVVLSALLERM